MTVFVSYVRADNDLATLCEIAAIVSVQGTPYVDDIHHQEHVGDRMSTVAYMLNSANAFVGVFSPNYLNTPWTCWEFDVARRRGIPMFALLPGGRLVELQPGELSVLSLVRSTLADSTLTTNATKLLTAGAKAISCVLLSAGIILLAIVGLMAIAGTGAIIGTALTASATSAAVVTRTLWRRRSASKKAINPR